MLILFRQLLANWGITFRIHVAYHMRDEMYIVTAFNDFGNKPFNIFTIINAQTKLVRFRISTSPEKARNIQTEARTSTTIYLDLVFGQGKCHICRSNRLYTSNAFNKLRGFFITSINSICRRNKPFSHFFTSLFLNGPYV